jgi:hypothetical protein
MPKPACSRRNRLQRKEVLPCPRPHRDAVGDRAAEQIIQRAGLCVSREPGILEIALDQAATFQRAADASGDLLDQLLQVARLGSRHGPKHGRLSGRSGSTSSANSAAVSAMRRPPQEGQNPRFLQLNATSFSA